MVVWASCVYTCGYQCRKDTCQSRLDQVSCVPLNMYSREGGVGIAGSLESMSIVGLWGLDRLSCGLPQLHSEQPIGVCHQGLNP